MNEQAINREWERVKKLFPSGKKFIYMGKSMTVEKNFALGGLLLE